MPYGAHFLFPMDIFGNLLDFVGALITEHVTPPIKLNFFIIRCIDNNSKTENVLKAGSKVIAPKDYSLLEV